MQILKNVIKCLNEAKVIDLKIYDTSAITPFYDQIINTTVSSSRQLTAVVKRLRDLSGQMNYELKGIEGLSGGYWALIDLRDVLVNVFLAEERERYDLDKLWKDLPQINPESYL